MTFDESLHPRGKGPHGGEWVKKLDSKISKDIGEVKPTPAKGRGPGRRPRGAATPTKSMVDRLASGEKSSKKLTGGTQAKVELVELNDGSRVVRKTVGKKKALARQLDAEELASKYGKALGLNAPEVHREGPTSIAMDYVHGRTASEIGMAGQPQVLVNARKSSDALKLGLFDLVIHNTDRHSGNWMVDGKGKIHPIDHGMAFQEPGNNSDQQLFSGQNSFINAIAGVVPGSSNWLYNGGTQPKSDKYSKADIAFMHKQLASLESEFQRLGRMDWYNNVQDQLDKLDTLADGNGKLF